eukprot:Skav205428  [mRNA]  locus=scaffold582:467958:469184:- [translate_table: standard]
MAKVLIASWTSLGDGGHILVTVRNLKGDELCSFQMQSATVGDLEVRLLDPEGPLGDYFSSPILSFYTAAETSRELDPRLQVCKLGDELYIHESVAGIWLEKWPDTGKFLQAMHYNKLDPRSVWFEINWKAETVPKVAPREALSLVKEVLHGWPTHSESECQFVQVFGKLTTSIESWRMFNLESLQTLDLSMRRFEHFICQHYIDLARTVATSLVSTDQQLPPIVMQFTQGCYVLGHTWPWPLSEDLSAQYSLDLQGLRPGFLWSPMSRGLRFWDWDFLQKGMQSFEVVSEVDHQEPQELQKLQPDEILQMVHVQLRLSSFKVAEVQGPLNEVCAKILAELLCYDLKILKYEDQTSFDAAIQAFDQEIEQRGQPDEFLVLVKSLPATRRGNIFAGHHRMILCYNADTNL